MTNRVAAVAVTFNRKELLKECLDALHMQTRRMEVFIGDMKVTRATLFNTCSGIQEIV